MDRSSLERGETAEFLCPPLVANWRGSVSVGECDSDRQSEPQHPYHVDCPIHRHHSAAARERTTVRGYLQSPRGFGAGHLHNGRTVRRPSDEASSELRLLPRWDFAELRVVGQLAVQPAGKTPPHSVSSEGLINNAFARLYISHSLRIRP